MDTRAGAGAGRTASHSARKAAAAAMLGRRSEPRLSDSASLTARIIHTVRCGATIEEAAAALAPAVDARFAEWAATHAAAPDQVPDAVAPGSLTDPLDRALVAAAYEAAPAGAAMGFTRYCLGAMRGRREGAPNASVVGLAIANSVVTLSAGMAVGPRAFDLLTTLNLVVRTSWDGCRAKLVAGIEQLVRLEVLYLDVVDAEGLSLDLRRMRLRSLTLNSDFGLVLGGRASESIAVGRGVCRADLEASARTVTRLRSTTRGLTIRRAAGFDALSVVDARVEVAGPIEVLRLRGGWVTGTLVAGTADVLGTRGGRVLAKRALAGLLSESPTRSTGGPPVPAVSADEGSAFEPPGGATLVIAPLIEVHGECVTRGEFRHVMLRRGAAIPTPLARTVYCNPIGGETPSPSACAPVVYVGRARHLVSYDLSRLTKFHAHSLGAAASGLVLDVLCMYGGGLRGERRRGAGGAADGPASRGEDHLPGATGGRLVVAPARAGDRAGVDAGVPGNHRRRAGGGGRRDEPGRADK